MSSFVFDAALRSADRLGEKTPSDGEAWSERHSYFDGSYWRQAFAAGGNVQLTGFVEGYLGCADHKPAGQRGSFPAAPAQYVRRISGSYQFDTTTADMNPDRENARIADVL